MTRYVAEFWNALSSFAICLVGVIALWLCHSFRLERRFYVLQSLVIVIGIGSAAFHGTLRYGTQMWDEIPMIWALLSWYYLLLQVHSPPRRGAPWLRMFLVVYAIVVCAFRFSFVTLRLLTILSARSSTIFALSPLHSKCTLFS